jgi:hypothetical protein
MVLILATKPEMLEDVMRLVIFLAIETGEVSEIAGIKSLLRQTERSHIRIDPVALFFRLCDHPQTIGSPARLFYCFSSRVFTRA